MYKMNIIEEFFFCFSIRTVHIDPSLQASSPFSHYQAQFRMIHHPAWSTCSSSTLNKVRNRDELYSSVLNDESCVKIYCKLTFMFSQVSISPGLTTFKQFHLVRLSDFILYKQLMTCLILTLNLNISIRLFISLWPSLIMCFHNLVDSKFRVQFYKHSIKSGFNLILLFVFYSTVN